MRVVIHPDFQHIADFVESVPSIFGKEGELIYDGRNKLRIFQVADMTLNVKSYKVPIFINRIVYTFFRATKAKRAYEYALKLLSLGIETPTPIAYIEEKESGLLSHSYFICMHTPLSGNLRLFGDSRIPFSDVKDLAVAFARYTAELHDKQVLHIDYSPGNILYEKREDGTFRFSLIDINRMKFCSVDMNTGCQSFCRMWGTNEFFETVASVYAQARGFDEKECVRLVLQYHEEDVRKRERKKELKKRFK